MATTRTAASHVPIYRLDNSILARIFEELIDETGEDLMPVLRLMTVCKLWLVSVMFRQVTRPDD
jgi:hypothetical protein